MERLRNSTDLFQKHVALWVKKVVRVAPALSESAQRDWHLLCTDLGVQPGVADFLSCSLQLRWEYCTLVDAEELEGVDVVGLVMNTQLDLCRFYKFNDSLWVQTGDTGRSLTVALLTGISDFVKKIRGYASMSEYFISGFARLGAPEKVFLAQAAVVSRVSDAAHFMLMEDGRVVSQV